jgi:hypothetical protein
MITESLITKCKSAKLTFEFIDPDMAKELLKANDKNYRKMISSCADRYTDDMFKQRWTITTATIAISKSKKLLDGQHRLSAIVTSGVGIWTYVLRDLPDELIDDPNQDKGKIRSVVTYMQREGIKNASVAAGAVRCLYRIAINVPTTRTGTTSLTDAAVLDVMLKMPVLFFDCVNRLNAHKTAKNAFAPSVSCAFFYLASCKNQDEANSFLAVFSKESDEASSHPANVLREYVNSYRKTISNDDFLSMAFTAFDLSMKRETRKIIRSCHGYTMHKEYKEALGRILELANAGDA